MRCPAARRLGREVLKVQTKICVACHKHEDATPDQPHIDGAKIYGLCPACRELIEIGRAVTEMKAGYSLEKTANRWFVVEDAMTRYVVLSDGATPTEALKGKKK